jgi:cystathionine beta-synthase
VRREVVDDEFPQVLGVRGRDPHEVVGDAGQMEHHQHAGKSPDGVRECVDLLARVHGEAHRDQRLERPAKRREVDLGVKAPDYAALAQRAQAGKRGRRGDPYLVGEALIRDPRILGHESEDRSVDGVDGVVSIIRHGAISVGCGRRISNDHAIRRIIYERLPRGCIIIRLVPMSTALEPMVNDSILDTIGDTPLVRLSRIGAGLRPQLVAKLEVFNPGGSIKDRVAIALIEAAERDGRLRPGGTIVEPTSGNTGTGLAIAARLKGYRVIAVMPDKMSREKIDLLRAYGADVVVAPTEVPPESPQSYYRVADRLTDEIPGAFQPNQYFNQANPQAHYESTGPELWEQTAGRITHLVAGVGTGGTITGTARYLRERNPGLVVVGADPEGSIYSGGPENVRPYLVEGVGEDFWPETFDPTVVDRWITVSDRDAFLTTRRLAQLEGILAGGSGGLALHAALTLAVELEGQPDALIVVILPDGGRSYLSKVYSDAWMRQYGFLEREPNLVVGDVLARKRDAGEIPSLVTVQSHFRVRDAVALLHEHRVSQLPVVSAHDPATVVGAIGERGLLKHAAEDPSLLDAEIVDVMEPPFPAVSIDDPVRDAVDLLVSDQQALLVTRDGRAEGLVTRTDLLEALAS